MMGAACLLLRWKQIESGSIGCEAFGENTLDELGDKREILSWTKRVYGIWFK
jgi:hypothetical protein